MKVRSRAISVTLAIGLFTTMGGCGQNAASLSSPRWSTLPPLRAQRLTDFFNSKTNVMPRTNQLREPQHH